MIVSTAILSLAIFMGGLWVFGVARSGADVLYTARNAVAILRDESVDDDTREQAARRASLQLLGGFVSILIRSAVALLASFSPIWLADMAGWVQTRDVVEFMIRWDVIAIAAIVVLGAYVALRRSPPSEQIRSL